MAKASQPDLGRVRAGTRVAELVNGSSIRVTIPSMVVSQLMLSPGEEVLIGATATGEVVVHPAGTPLVEATTVFGGSVKLQSHNGSVKAVLAADAVDATEIEPGDELGFEFERHGCVYVIPEG